MKIPVEHIIEIGLLRKRNKCALCNAEMKSISNHNIQLCLRCRKIEFKKLFKKIDKAKFISETGVAGKCRFCGTELKLEIEKQ